ncbi:ornithine cyclodeaminase [uncultured Litoreibacter sp.]|uniref:ornithine cyclodeaminase family protein n=1 Tax=uncultured Litoreibacter sp. TaxID=1392394 RepID=UPI002632C12A|nr:ornithine cyclodeaminase [uncultured Litoreibacter sp.]
MTAPVISFDDADPLLNWAALTDALAKGHTFPKAEIGDTFLYRKPDTLLSRAAWIDGLGQAVKTATVFPENAKHGLPNIHGSVSLFSDKTGQLDAMIDFHLVTKWKTAGDSLFAAKQLARPNSNAILLVGAGTVAANMVSAYRSHWPNAEVTVWTRNADKGQSFAKANGIAFEPDLQAAVTRADIICCATMTTEPVINGAWLQPGQHLDLIGAYRPDMREVDDVALQRARLFVDSRDTTLDHIGELKIPLATGAITPADVIASFYEPDDFVRRSDEEITIAKNGGGAHLDLMTSRYILDAWSQR